MSDRWHQLLEETPSAEHIARVEAAVAPELEAHRRDQTVERGWRWLIGLAPFATAILMAVWPRRPRVDDEQLLTTFAQLEADGAGLSTDDLEMLEELELIEELEVLESWNS